MTLRLLATAARLALAVPLALVMRLLRPAVLIRLHSLRAERMGHFALEPEIYLCRRDQAPPPRRRLDLFYCTEPICNRQLRDMWARALPVHAMAGAVDRVSRRLPGHRAHVVPWEDRDWDELMYRTPAHLALTGAELARGQRELKALGIPTDRPFACLFNRDDAYLEEALPAYDWSHHRFRDGDIQSYRQAAEELAELGYTVVRLGNVVREPLVTSSPHVFDYASIGASDFLDVFLFATCDLAVCALSGLCCLGPTLRRPLALVNVAAIFDVIDPPMGHLFTPKLHRASDGHLLTFSEMVEVGSARFSRAEEFAGAGIEVVPSSADEIAGVALELHQRTTGTWQPSQDDEELQHRFWASIGFEHRAATTPVRIAAHFLREHRELVS